MNKKNPFTGEEYFREVTDYGVAESPSQSSHLIHSSLTPTPKGKTRTMSLKSEDEYAIFKDIAKGLSEMTGCDIRFIDCRSDATFGNFGFFGVLNPKIKFPEN